MTRTVTLKCSRRALATVTLVALKLAATQLGCTHHHQAGSRVQPASVAEPPGDAATLLHALFDEAWDRSMREHPDWASILGDHRFDDRWPDHSLAAIEASHVADLEVLQRLASIDRAALSANDQLNYDLFKRVYEHEVAAHRFRPFLAPLSHHGGVQTLDELREQLRFETLRDYESWNARLEAVGAVVDQTIALLRQGIAEKRVAPRVVMQRLPEQIDSQIVEAPEHSPFYEPFTRMPESFSQELRARLRSAARQAINDVVVPAYDRFRTFFADTYLPATRDSVGIWDYPDGDAYYRFMIRHHTTTSMSAEEIHSLGLREVARIRAEMDKVIEQVGFVGGFEEFQEFLLTDPQFYYDKPEDLLAAYQVTCKRIDPELPRLFGRLPRIPYGVRSIPDAVAPDMTTAYYLPPAADGTRAGYYYVNLHNLRARPKYEIEVLTVHEAVPGHHLQVALAQELTDLPHFRRYGSVSAFLEGWALYSESLGYELGLYRDPYSKFGQLTYDMWRAVRLVVDTGMHHFRWDRERAVDYFRENAARAEHDIQNEIDRYIVLPGQALAYKIGQLKILQLRQRAKQRLGDSFDIRAFHDVILGSGAVSLDILEQQVEDYLARTDDP